jgi:hypothetical protein
MVLSHIQSGNVNISRKQDEVEQVGSSGNISDLYSGSIWFEYRS